MEKALTNIPQVPPLSLGKRRSLRKGKADLPPPRLWVSCVHWDAPRVYGIAIGDCRVLPLVQWCSAGALDDAAVDGDGALLRGGSERA